MGRYDKNKNQFNAKEHFLIQCILMQTLIIYPGEHEAVFKVDGSGLHLVKSLHNYVSRFLALL